MTKTTNGLQLGLGGDQPGQAVDVIFCTIIAVFYNDAEALAGSLWDTAKAKDRRGKKGKNYEETTIWTVLYSLLYTVCWVQCAVYSVFVYLYTPLHGDGAGEDEILSHGHMLTRGLVDIRRRNVAEKWGKSYATKQNKIGIIIII